MVLAPNWLDGLRVGVGGGSSNVARAGCHFDVGGITKAWSAGAASNGQQWTASLFFEIADLSSEQVLWSTNSANSADLIYISTTGDLTIAVGVGVGGTPVLVKSALFTTATKYYLLIAFDAANGTGSNRLRVWYGTYGGSAPTEITSWDSGDPADIDAGAITGFSDPSSSIYLADYYLFPGTGIFRGKIADVYVLDGQAITTPSTFVTSNVKPLAASPTFGNNGFHLDFASSGDLGNDVSGNNNDFTIPVATNPVLISGATGTNIGTGTGGGGLAAAYDGTTNQAIAACASLSGNNAIYVGKDWGAGTEKRIHKAEIWGSNDNGYVAGSDPTVTLTMRSNTTSPGSSTAGTSQGTTSFLDTGNESGNVRTITSSDNVTAIRFWHIATGTHNANKGIAEIKWYEAVDTAYIDSSDQVTPYL